MKLSHDLDLEALKAQKLKELHAAIEVYRRNKAAAIAAATSEQELLIVFDVKAKP